MENLDFSWRIKGGVSDEGSFVGLASPYGDPPDYQNDVVAKGLSLSRSGNSRRRVSLYSGSTPTPSGRHASKIAALALR